MKVPIKGYEGSYDITDDGKVFSHHTSRWLKLGRGSHGYFQCRLCCDGVKKMHLIHRLVAQAFIPNPDHLPQINHKDGDRANSRADNLEWCNNSYNNRHSYAMLGRKPNRQRPVLGIHIASGVRIYMPNTHDAAKFVNGSKGNIWSACKGKYRHAYGYIWRYLDEINQINSEIAA